MPNTFFNSSFNKNPLNKPAETPQQVVVEKLPQQQVIRQELTPISLNIPLNNSSQLNNLLKQLLQNYLNNFGSQDPSNPARNTLSPPRDSNLQCSKELPVVVQYY